MSDIGQHDSEALKDINDLYRISNDEIEVVNIDSILEDVSNSRQHPERNIRSIMASLQRFGQQRPVVVSPKNIIIAGNGTHRAMKAMGFEKIAIVRSELDGPEATAFGIADNQIALTSEWDFQSLSEHVKALQDWEADFDFQVIGFEAHEIDPMLHADWTPPEVKSGEGGADDGPKMGDPIKVTVEQREVIERAINQLRRNEGEPTLSEGRCLEYICTEWLQVPEKPVAKTIEEDYSELNNESSVE